MVWMLWSRAFEKSVVCCRSSFFGLMIPLNRPLSAEKSLSEITMKVLRQKIN